MTNSPKIEFLSSHRPHLPYGDYTIDITQTINAPHGAPKQVATNVATHSFSVRGERFSLKPSDIHSLFPPDQSRGEYSAALPHVILTRSTLPWERTAQGAVNIADSPPWLALLLFTEAELAGAKPQVMTLAQLTAGSTTGTYWPPFTLQRGQDPQDKVTVIDIPKKVLSPMMPSLTELSYLTHARLVSGALDPKENHEFAVVVGNRLPQKGEGEKPPVLVAHLVSVEGRYSNGAFTYQGAGDSDKIRLISLKRWSFSCVEHKHTFTGLLTNLDQGALQSPQLKKIPATTAPATKTLAEAALRGGKIPLRHHFRNGQKSVSWYHGPLLPLNDSATAIANHSLTGEAFPNQSADGLLRYDDASGLFDVSYAAAWELGRLLALNSKSFSVALYHWKRANAQTMRALEQQELHPHKPHTTSFLNSYHLPKEIERWLSDLSQLKQLPFTYLVPDPALLPAESIRFFTLDPVWIASLVDGAFSIGRASPAESAAERTQLNQAKIPAQSVSGFLLRSAVVSGWPSLQADAFNGATALKKLRIARLSPNVLLCLFEGDATEFDIHQPQETIHSGFAGHSGVAGQSPAYTKPLRKSDGSETAASVPVPLKQDSEQKQTVLMLEDSGGNKGLYQLIKAKMLGLGFEEPYSVGQFALELIEGVPKVKYTIKAS